MGEDEFEGIARKLRDQQQAHDNHARNGIAEHPPVVLVPPPADDIPHAVDALPPPRPDIDERRLTEIGNARRLAARFGHRLRYVHSWGKWLAWDGQRWCRDELGSDMIAAKAVADSLYADASALSARAAAGDSKAGDIAEACLKFARTSSKASSCRAMLALAQSEEPISASASEFDRHPFALNLLNGTFDLETGKLRPHRQTDLITRLAPVAYNADAPCPKWNAFLETVLPDHELRAFVQRFVGYCLTGDVREQLLGFLHGLGANGKSVLLDVMLALLGDYACRAAPDLLLAKQNETHPTEIADLEGRRLVVCSEIEQGREWSEALIKRITGDTTIKARHMREDFYEFSATFKLAVSGNHRPKMKSTDNGIWRRMRLIPFGVTIAKDKQDKKLVTNLIAAEASGILNWAIAGCTAWLGSGLGEPLAVVEATASYREEQDVLGLWIAEECTVQPHVWSKTAELHAAFTAWCSRTGRHPWMRDTMRERLLERPGIAVKNKEEGRGLTGIALASTRTPPPAAPADA